MNNECTVSVYDHVEQAQQAAEILQWGNFPVAQVSMVTKGLQDRPQALEEIEMGGDDSVRDAAVGAGLGGVVGLLGGAELSAILGLGSVFFFGPIGLGLTGTVVGAFLGGIAGWGVHEKRIQHYEEAVKQGKVLLIATGSPLQLIQADRILKETGPLEHHVYAKTSSEAAEVNADKNLPKTLVPRHATGSTREPAGEISRPGETQLPGEHATSLEQARDRFNKAVRILADEKTPIKKRLLIAFASQLSQVDKQHLPDEVGDDFWQLRNALSDADMPYGSGQRAKEKIDALTDDEATSFARMIHSMSLKVSSIFSSQR